MSGYFRAYSNRVREASRELEERELRVYLALLSYANCKGMCWPGIATMVRETGIHTDGIYSAIDALVAQKYVVIVREGARDPLTRQQWPNVYLVDGAMIDENCDDDEFRTDDPILFQGEKKNRNTTNQQTQEQTKVPKQPENTTTNTTTFPEVEVPKQEKAAEKAADKKQKRAALSAAPARSAIPQTPNPVPPPPSPKFYRGPLGEFAEPLPDEQEASATTLYETVERKLPIRLARKLVADYGQERVDWALRHLAKQKDVFNPPGYVRALLERQAIEQLDAVPPNPADKYLRGEYADLIDH